MPLSSAQLNIVHGRAEPAAAIADNGAHERIFDRKVNALEIMQLPFIDRQMNGGLYLLRNLARMGMAPNPERQISNDQAVRRHLFRHSV